MKTKEFPSPPTHLHAPYSDNRVGARLEAHSGVENNGELLESQRRRHDEEEEEEEEKFGGTETRREEEMEERNRRRIMRQEDDDESFMEGHDPRATNDVNVERAGKKHPIDHFGPERSAKAWFEKHRHHRERPVFEGLEEKQIHLIETQLHDKALDLEISSRGRQAHVIAMIEGITMSEFDDSTWTQREAPYKETLYLLGLELTKEESSQQAQLERKEPSGDTTILCFIVCGYQVIPLTKNIVTWYMGQNNYLLVVPGALFTQFNVPRGVDCNVIDDLEAALIRYTHYRIKPEPIDSISPLERRMSPPEPTFAQSRTSKEQHFVHSQEERLEAAAQRRHELKRCIKKEREWSTTDALDAVAVGIHKTTDWLLKQGLSADEDDDDDSVPQSKARAREEPARLNYHPFDTGDIRVARGKSKTKAKVANALVKSLLYTAAHYATVVTNQVVNRRAIVVQRGGENALMTPGPGSSNSYDEDEIVKVFESFELGGQKKQQQLENSVGANIAETLAHNPYGDEVARVAREGISLGTDQLETWIKLRTLSLGVLAKSILKHSRYQQQLLPRAGSAGGE